MTYKLSNARYLADGRIDVEWDHPDFGVVTFTASPTDPEPHGREIFNLVKNSAAPYVPGNEPVQFPILTPRQFWLAAANIGISKEQVLAQIDANLPAMDAMLAKIELNETINFERAHPTVQALSSLMAIPSEQLDSLWLWAGDL